MGTPEEETTRRIILAKREAERLREFSLGVVLVGSVAYAPNLHVTEKSDLDLIVISDDIKAFIYKLTENEQEKNLLKAKIL